MKHIYILVGTILLSFIGFGQTEIFNEAGGDSAPVGWTFQNIVPENQIDRGSYWLVEASSSSMKDYIITESFDLSSFSSAEFSISVATFGSGTNHPARIEVSIDGGASYSQTITSNTPSGSSYINGGTFPLNAISSQVVLRISNNGISNKGVRLRNLILTASGVSTNVEAPSSLAASTISASQINLSYEPNATNDNVVIVYNTDNNFTEPSGTPPGAESAFAGGTVLVNDTGTSYNHTGLSEATTYYYMAYSYNLVDDEYSLGLSATATTPCTTPSEVTLLEATAANGSATLDWNNGSCFDEILVVAKASASITATPSGDGTGYIADASFGSGTDLGNNEFVVYKGTQESVTVTDLTNSTAYYFKVFTRKGTTWSTGVETDATPEVAYCSPSPSSVDDEGIINVSIGTINKPSSTEPNNYGDYSEESTDVFQGAMVNCDITYQTGYSYNTKIWVDYNNDGDFNDNNEEVYSGESLQEDSTTLSATFTIPIDAALGQHRLRIGGADISTPTPCYSGSYASFEDYTINIVAPSTDTRVQFTTAEATVTEAAGTYNLDFSILNEDATTATTFEVALSTGDASDIDNYTTQTVTFPAGTATNQTLSITITDDTEIEMNETLSFTIQNVVGGSNAAAGAIDTFDLTITNNDVEPPIALPYLEDFEDCAEIEFTSYDQDGNDFWICNGGQYAINGYSGTDDIDWLISDFTIDFDAYYGVSIEVTTQEAYGNTVNEPGEFELRYSTDYSGSGDPTSATWTALDFNPNNTSSSSSPSNPSTAIVDASGISGIAYLAFFYDMTASSSAEDWRILDISIAEVTAPADTDTEIYEASPQIAATTVIAATATTSETDVEAFGFVIEDQGTTDGLPTNVTRMRFVPGTNNTADWTDQIQGITLYDENLEIYTPTATINDDEIILDFASPIVIADGSALEFVFGFYLNTTAIVDGSIIQFQIEDTSNGFTADENGSGFTEDLFLDAVISNNVTIDVDAINMVFSQQPSNTETDIAMVPAVSISAVDANGNMDSDYNLEVTLTSTGTLTEAPITEAALNGVATFNNLIHTESGMGLILTASDGFYTDVNSDPFDISVPPIVIAIQDFDGSLPEWTYTTNIPTFGDNSNFDDFYGVINLSNASPIDNINFHENIFGENDLENNNGGTSGFATLTFDDLDISTQSNISLTFDWDIEGYNANSDDAKYEVFYDGVGQGEVFLLDGGNGIESDEGSVAINVPDYVNALSLAISIRNNGADGYSGFDNFKVMSTPTCNSFIGNGYAQFEGALGNGSLDICAVTEPAIEFTFTKNSEAPFNDIVVLYIDSKPGGFTTTANFTDIADGGRKAVSGYNGTERSTVTFPPSFTADYAIIIKNDFAGMFELVENGSHTFIPTTNFNINENQYDFEVNYTDLETTLNANSFKFVATYISDTAFRSNETIGKSTATSDANIGYGALTFNTYFRVNDGKQGGKAASQDEGLWSSASTWENGNSPLLGDEVSINNDVNLDINYETIALEIFEGANLTIDPSANLTLAGGGIEGSGVLNVSGKLTITEGGFSTITPTYTVGSTLEYRNISEVYNRFNEWTDAASGIGVPDNVIIENTNLDLTNSTQSFEHFTVSANMTLRANANLTVDANESLSIGGDLLNTGGSMDFNSTSTQYSSLVVEGTSTGDVIYRRHVNIVASPGSTTGSNDLISAPVVKAGDTFLDFRSHPENNDLYSGSIDGEIAYLFGPFDNDLNEYTNFTSANDGDALIPGKGYRSGSTNAPLGSTFTFNGNVETTPVAIEINVGTASVWNLIGNPYPSYIDGKAFLSANLNQFDQDAVAIYGYIGSVSDGWEIINLLTDNEDANLTPGQGFMVAAEGTANLTFTPAMRRIGSTDDFIMGRTNEVNAHLRLQIANGSSQYHTDFYFNDNSTLGLDPGYDAAFYNGYIPNFHIYSHLVEDNVGRSMAIQALNPIELSEVSIPLGVKANQGQQLTFSITESTLADGVNIYLEDTVANTLTLLSTSDYSFTPTQNLSGTGRFYLRYADNTLSTQNNSLNTVEVYASQITHELIINGNFTTATKADIYDVQGRWVASQNLHQHTLQNRMDVSQLNSGIYIVTLNSQNNSRSVKVILK